MNVARTKSEAKAHHEAEARAEAETLAAKVKDKVVTVKVKGGASGKLYGKVTSKDVAEALSKLIGARSTRKRWTCPPASRSLAATTPPSSSTPAFPPGSR